MINLPKKVILNLESIYRFIFRCHSITYLCIYQKILLMSCVYVTKQLNETYNTELEHLVYDIHWNKGNWFFLMILLFHIYYEFFDNHFRVLDLIVYDLDKLFFKAFNGHIILNISYPFFTLGNKCSFFSRRKCVVDIWALIWQNICFANRKKYSSQKIVLSIIENSSFCMLHIKSRWFY